MTVISQDIKSQLGNLSCESVAEKLGIEVKKHRALCFMHDDHHPSLAFTGSNRERWKCFVCNKGGDAIQFVIEATGLSFIEACRWLGLNFGISVDANVPVKRNITVSRAKKRPMISESKPFSIKVAQWLIENNRLTETGKAFLYKQRKLKPEVIAQLNVISIDDAKKVVENMKKMFDVCALEDSGFITQTKGKLYFRMFTPCLIFPYYDRSGNLVGVQSRYLGTNEDAPRFQFVAAQRTRLFNLPILESMKWGEDLYISEGITDCLALLSAGKKAVAIPSATILPQYDLIQLKNFKLHMYPDQDEAGKLAFMKLRRFFVNHYISFHEEQLPDGITDYSEYYKMNHEK